MPELYTLKKQGKTWCVLAISSGIVQYRHTQRSACVEWLENNG